VGRSARVVVHEFMSLDVVAEAEKIQSRDSLTGIAP
jgi:hypothetical protein